jgi:hypothetical protein
VLAVSAAGFSAIVWGWNPYDTDSSRVERLGVQPSSPGSYLAPGNPGQWPDPGAQSLDRSPGDWDSNSRWYLPESAEGERWSDVPTGEYGWESYSRPAERSERQRWEEGTAWRARQYGAQQEQRFRDREYGEDPYRADRFDSGPGPYSSDDSWRQRSLYDDFTQNRQQHPSRRPEFDSGPVPKSEWRSRDYQSSAERSASKPREDRFNGYRFRHDPALTEKRGGGRNGWDFRPLTDRDQERRRTPGLYPQIDERDYIQRGPWRSYQDEGTAFGYHSNDRAPSSDSYWGR